MEQRAGWVKRPIGSDNATFIDRGAHFEGTLHLTESLRIDSDFRGTIVSEATVIVGESAGIEADIRAREVVIQGAVVGNVSATRLVSIRAGAKLHGNVETPCLEIEKRAVFNGSTTMVRPEAALRSALGAPQASEAAPAAPPRTA